MGLLDQLTGALSGGATEGESSPFASILELVNNPKIGGISGLVEKFQQGGLSEIVNSWVSTGQNLPISADQLENVLGSEKISELAGQMGVSPGQASGSLAEILPQIVDKLTPGGQVPEGGDLMSQGLGLLKGKLFN